MTTAITVRLDDADHASLRRQAEQLGVRPGTLARMMVRAGLESGSGPSTLADTRAAIERLVRRSHTRPPADAVTLVHEARSGLSPDR